MSKYTVNLKMKTQGHLGGRVGWTSDFSSGHDSQFVGSSPSSNSVLIAQNLEPALDSVSPSLSPCPSLTHALSLSLSLILSPSLSLSKINKHKKIFNHENTNVKYVKVCYLSDIIFSR